MQKNNKVKLYPNNCYMGIDLGSSKISVVIAAISKENQLDILGLGTSISAGIHKGKITSRIDVQNALERAIKRAERDAGISTENILINLPLEVGAITENSGIVPIKEISGQVQETDKKEAIKKLKTITKSAHQAIMHVIPKEYKVDGQIVSNPIGKQGGHLDVTANLVLGDIQNISIVKECCQNINRKIKGIVADILALSEISINTTQKQNGILLIDFGGQFLRASLYKYNQLQWANTIPIGGETITNDIAQCLKVTLPEAERLKIIYGQATIEGIALDEKIQIVTTNGPTMIKRRMLSEIIEARIEEALSLLLTSDQLSQISGVKLSGNSSLLKKFGAVVSAKTNQPIIKNQNQYSHTKLQGHNYSIALGVLAYGQKSGVIHYKSPQKTNLLKKLIKF